MTNPQRQTSKTTWRNAFMRAVLPSLFVCASLFASSIAPAAAQNINSNSAPININDKGFKFVVCDGPTLPKGMTPPSDPYVPCDFNGLIATAQHLINIAIVGGVFAFIIGFCFMGYWLVTGTESNRKKAKDLFPKIFWGFIIMLSAWFIVYQILSWLTDNSMFKSLLGK